MFTFLAMMCQCSVLQTIFFSGSNAFSHNINSTATVSMLEGNTEAPASSCKDSELLGCAATVAAPAPSTRSPSGWRHIISYHSIPYHCDVTS